MSNELDDPCEWPEMPGSHGPKDPVGPYHLDDSQVELLLLATLKNLEVPWQGDRIAKETMKCVLTVFWYALSQLGYYD